MVLQTQRKTTAAGNATKCSISGGQILRSSIAVPARGTVNAAVRFSNGVLDMGLQWLGTVPIAFSTMDTLLTLHTSQHQILHGQDDAVSQGARSVEIVLVMAMILCTSTRPIIEYTRLVCLASQEMLTNFKADTTNYSHCVCHCWRKDAIAHARCLSKLSYAAILGAPAE